jgi:hypothetical protein
MTLLPALRDTSAQRLLWLAILAGAGTIASAAFACATPFAAVAALAALTLTRHVALIVVALLWLGNQAVGYLLIDYPWTANSLAWGIALGLASLTAAIAAAPAVRVANPAARLVGAFVIAFAAYQAVLFAAAFVLDGGDAFSLDIVAYIAGVNALWAAGLAITRVALDGLTRAAVAT